MYGLCAVAKRERMVGVLPHSRLMWWYHILHHTICSRFLTSWHSFPVESRTTWASSMKFCPLMYALHITYYNYSNDNLHPSCPRSLYSQIRGRDQAEPKLLFFCHLYNPQKPRRRVWIFSFLISQYSEYTAIAMMGYTIK